jgi:hypothetical protein
MPCDFHHVGVFLSTFNNMPAAAAAGITKSSQLNITRTGKQYDPSEQMT